MLLSGIDHVAFTVSDVAESYAFYDRLFGAATLRDFAPEGRSLVRGITVGGAARMSLHQAGNGVELVAAVPTPGSVDICFRWTSSIAQAAAHLAAHAVTIIEGPSPRITADGLAAYSVYFRDPDGNLIELMAAD